MFKFINKKKNNKGFTLVELVIVVAILAILVGILAPQYTKYVEKSRKAADASNLENLVTVMKTAASDSTDALIADTYTITIAAGGTTITGTQNGATAKAEAVANEFAGDNWKSTTLKSKNWGVTEIKAEVTVENDGKVTVEYTPDTINAQ